MSAQKVYEQLLAIGAALDSRSKASRLAGDTRIARIEGVEARAYKFAAQLLREGALSGIDAQSHTYGIEPPKGS